MKKGIVIGALAGGLTFGAAAAHADTVEVANGAELAAAITQANSDASVTKIVCATKEGCNVVGTLPTYTAGHRLVIDGRFSTVDASAVTNDDAFASVGGGVLKLIRMNFVGGLTGVYVEVPASKTNDQRVEFRKVKVSDTILHGGLVSDPNGAPAGIDFVVFKSNFIDNGTNEVDQDGLYIEETGPGSVVGEATDSFLQRNGSDGFGISEAGGGSVKVTITNCDMRENGLNTAKPGDPDDGLDIDEGSKGNVLLTVTDSRFNLNYDDGIDLDERGVGDLIADMTNVKASKNADQGMTFDERGDGDLIVDIADGQITGNDKDSQEIDMRGDQADEGTGIITLVNTNVGQVWLDNVDLVTVP